MPLPELIGLAGRMQAGKDTLGAHLVQRYGYSRIAFADKLKLLLGDVDPIITASHTGALFRLSDVLEDRTMEEAKLVSEVRRLLQALGNHAQTYFGPTCWVDAAMRDVAPGKRYVITDVRYIHEVEALHELGGRVFRIQRPETDNHGDTHVSETQLDCYGGFDGYILNKGSLDEYLEEAMMVLNG